jgi:uncharacterized protein
VSHSRPSPKDDAEKATLEVVGSSNRPSEDQGGRDGQPAESKGAMEPILRRAFGCSTGRVWRKRSRPPEDSPRRRKIGPHPAVRPSPREHHGEIILNEGRRNDAVGEKAEVHDNPFEGRYEIRLDGRTAGFTVYKSKPNLIAFVHTEVDPSLEGRGLGSRLIGSALEDARERGLEVLPFCPFVNEFIRRHRDEYVELVPERYRQEFGL